MAKRVNEQEKQKIWELYQKYGSISVVAKKSGRCRSTVSRYVGEYEAATRATAYILNGKNDLKQYF